MNIKTWAIVITASLIGLLATFYWGGVGACITLLSLLVVLFVTKVVEEKKQEEIRDTLLDTKDIVTDKLDGIADEVSHVGNAIMRGQEEASSDKRFGR